MIFIDIFFGDGFKPATSRRVTTSKVEGGIHAELKIIEVPRHGSSVQKKGNEERATTLLFPVT